MGEKGSFYQTIEKYIIVICNKYRKTHSVTIQVH